MASDEERRDVARRLRRKAEKLGPNMDAHEFANYTADVLDVDECMTWYQMMLRLVNLIEPSPSCVFWDTEEQECYSVRTVKPVDRDALLGLAEEIEDNDVTYSVSAQYVLDSYARRIREALGVTGDAQLD